MSDTATSSEPTEGTQFTWHPEYRGRSAAAVRTSILAELSSDQRAYALSLEGAEEHESDALNTVLTLERKWGQYDLNWAELNPEDLADRILAFELERERRQELFPYDEYRRSHPIVADAAAGSEGATLLESPAIRLAIVVVIAIILLALGLSLIR